MKTVILCRHAESKENVKIRAYKDGMAKLKTGSLPSKNEVSKSLSLLKYNTDQAVSPLGNEQIKIMSETVMSENFLETFQPEVVVHSPLTRAKETCRGIFGQRDNDMELACLTEMSPMEIFLFKNSVNVRIKEFEAWLDSRSEERIIAVGHSRYFQVMLNAEEVMDNCSIIQCSFLPPTSPPDSSPDVKIVTVEMEDDKDVQGGGHKQRQGQEQGQGVDINSSDTEVVVIENRGRWKVERVLYTLKEINENKNKKEHIIHETEETTDI